MMASVVTSQIEKKTPQFQCVKLKKIQNIKKYIYCKMKTCDVIFCK